MSTEHVQMDPATAARVAREQAERDRQAAEQHAIIAEAERRHAAEQRAADERAAQARADELAAAEAVPVDDDVDADPEVAALEERIAAGGKVTAEQLAEERTRAAGRVRFARLRDLAAQRKARKDAEALELEQAAAADQYAREALAPHTGAELVGKYDAAVTALRELGEALDARNATIRRLVRLAHADRPRGAQAQQGLGDVDRVKLDGVLHGRQDVGQVIGRAIESAGLSRKNLTMVDREHFRIDESDPRIIAEGRAQRDG